MRKSVCVLFLSVVLLFGLAGSAFARGYAASIDTTLTLVFGEPVFEDQAPGSVIDWFNENFESITMFSEGEDSSDLKLAELVGPELEIKTTDGWEQIVGSWDFNYRDLVTLRTASTPTNEWNVRVAVTAPEPSTFILVGLGTIGVIGIMRRKKQKKSMS